jgi:hypothetical protein
MKRRKLIYGGGVLTMFGGIIGYGILDTTNDSDGSTQEAAFESEAAVPEDLKPTRQVALDFHEQLQEYYPDAGVYLRSEEVVATFSPESSSPDGVKAEIHRLGKLFANTFAETDDSLPAPTFTAVTGKVQGIIAPSVLEAYRAGELQESAVVETVEITSIERTGGSSETTSGHDHSSHDHAS